jgi:glutathione-regulated potassium-efflux system ancillary protein KefF
MVTLIYAHPYPQHSRLGKTLLSSIQDLSDIQIRPIYDLYPDFHINIKQEQENLEKSDLIIIQHPLYWYHSPALLSLWFEKVLENGWAYGKDKEGKPVKALKGKQMWWVVTTGSDQESYTHSGSVGFPFDTVGAPFKMIANFCEMEWLTPFVIHDGHDISAEELDLAANRYRKELLQLLEQS